MQKKKGVWSKKIIWILIGFYFVYVLCTAALPFLRHKSVSDEFAASVSTSDFYAETPCVDRVALVESPSEAFDTRIHILDEATERIDISYYAMHMGETTDLFLGALLEAADRGVQVRILVDGMFGGLTQYHRIYAAALGAHPNIELKVYNTPYFFKPWTWNGRLHDKYIIVDDRLLLLGGRNIGDKYFDPDGYDRQLSYDRDVLVYNTAWDKDNQDSVLFAVREYMDSLWESADVREPFSKDTKRSVEKRQELLDTLKQFCIENPRLFDHTEDNYEAWTYPANRITLFCNDTQIWMKEPKAEYILSELLLDAKESVLLQSPYVILDPVLEKLLKELGEADIDAVLLTNSAASSPNPIAFAAYMGDRKTLLKTGICLWEYQDSNSIHAKTYLIDDRMAVVGSYNLDPRSAYLDTEMLLAIDSEGFAQHLRRTQEEYIQQSLEVDDSGKYITNSTVSEQSVMFIKRCFLYVLSLPAQRFKCLI